ncbi:hypothetical protein ACFQAT_28500 [Undibacterium arcticum]|uniref:hypothetical protein n=1 Tax=Undibacterium arcticum TaxID=1762892 RepID=UPI003609C7CE
MSFEEILKIFEKSGILLGISTLERYYYSLKTEEDLAKEATKFANSIVSVRKAIESNSLKVHQEHGAKLAYQFRRGESQTPQLYDALSQLEPASPAKIKKPADAGSKTTGSPLANPSAPKPPASGPSIVNREKTDLRAEARPIQTTAVGQAAATEALTVDQLEAISMATEERSQIIEDLDIRNDHVYSASGAPFVGPLTKKQIHLLRTAGRIIAPTNGKSSKDFVSMPSVI